MDDDAAGPAEPARGLRTGARDGSGFGVLVIVLEGALERDHGAVGPDHMTEPAVLVEPPRAQPHDQPRGQVEMAWRFGDAGAGEIEIAERAERRDALGQIDHRVAGEVERFEAAQRQYPAGQLVKAAAGQGEALEAGKRRHGRGCSHVAEVEAAQAAKSGKPVGEIAEGIAAEVERFQGRQRVHFRRQGVDPVSRQFEHEEIAERADFGRHAAQADEARAQTAEPRERAETGRQGLDRVARLPGPGAIALVGAEAHGIADIEILEGSQRPQPVGHGGQAVAREREEFEPGQRQDRRADVGQEIVGQVELEQCLERAQRRRQGIETAMTQGQRALPQGPRPLDRAHEVVMAIAPGRIGGIVVGALGLGHLCYRRHPGHPGFSHRARLRSARPVQIGRPGG